MSWVLLTGGVDLSVGSIMLVAAAVAGKLALAGVSLPLCVLAMLAVGLAIGLGNALLIARLGLVPFVATLGVLYVGRGGGLWLTETRAIALPDPFLTLSAWRVAEIPLPLVVLLLVSGGGQFLLTRTTFGRHVLAVGHSRAAAEQAGIATQRILAAVYVISALLASVGALLALGQLGTVSPTFGEKKEFTAIAVAVIGGTSLFGGRGSLFPGPIIGALLIQTVESGLVMQNANPYLYPVVVAVTIFVAVLLDGWRNALAQRLQRRPIFVNG